MTAFSILIGATLIGKTMLHVGNTSFHLIVHVIPYKTVFSSRGNRLCFIDTHMILKKLIQFLECLWNHDYFGSLAKLTILCKRPEVIMIL